MSKEPFYLTTPVPPKPWAKVHPASNTLRVTLHNDALNLTYAQVDELYEAIHRDDSMPKPDPDKDSSRRWSLNAEFLTYDEVTLVTHWGMKRTEGIWSATDNGAAAERPEPAEDWSCWEIQQCMVTPHWQPADHYNDILRQGYPLDVWNDAAAFARWLIARQRLYEGCFVKVGGSNWRIVRCHSTDEGCVL